MDVFTVLGCTFFHPPPEPACTDSVAPQIRAETEGRVTLLLHIHRLTSTLATGEAICLSRGPENTVTVRCDPVSPKSVNKIRHFQLIGGGWHDIIG